MDEVSLTIRAEGVPKVNPNPYDDDAYLQATVDTLPNALMALWESGVTGSEFISEVVSAIENIDLR